MTRFPKHIAACSLVCGEKSFLATSMMVSAFTDFRISLWPKNMKFLLAEVPWSRRNISSDFSTKFMS